MIPKGEKVTKNCCYHPFKLIHLAHMYRTIKILLARVSPSPLEFKNGRASVLTSRRKWGKPTIQLAGYKSLQHYSSGLRAPAGRKRNVTAIHQVST